MTTKKLEQLRGQLKWLRARHDSGAVNDATWTTMKALEQDIAWEQHRLSNLQP